MFWFNTGQNEASTYHENQNSNASISLKLVIISVTLMSLKCDSGVIL